MIQGLRKTYKAMYSVFMITNDDIKKLREVFDTKQDGEKRHKETLKRFDGIDKRFNSMDKRFDTVDEALGNITNALGAIFQWNDDVHRAIVGKPVKRLHDN